MADVDCFIADGWGTIDEGTALVLGARMGKFFEFKTVNAVLEPLYQGADRGALPTLRAATDPGVHGGQYYGPGGIGELRGYPKVVPSSDQSHDVKLQRRLWEVSEDLTGVVYPVG